MNFNTVRIVLVGTTHPGNIGSAARAMKTMGFQRLVLVSPKIFPDLKAREMAAGADDILENAIVVDSLDKALEGAQLVLAMSARPRHLSLPGFTPADGAQFLMGFDDSVEIAILFGREHAGLTNDELMRCQYHIQIPSDPLFKSLNLAQSVQIMTYELRMRLLNPEAQVTMNQEGALATTDDMERFHVHLNQVLTAIQFLKVKNPGRVPNRLRRLFNRDNLEKTEVNMLRGMLTHIQRVLKFKDSGEHE